MNLIITTETYFEKIPNVDLVVNLGIPFIEKRDKEGNKTGEDFDTYLHRIKKASKHGNKGIALSIFNN